ncbi:3-hydroxy-3-methylglutaryl-coenzyme A (HMG-CoA) reductase isozyme [Mortierella sp. AD094]|nr:3-hydroxy-3-methylglutaryl-coenzyme A (HMG-CoA) reductase isozyme [Mortierella sp. AD094]
MRKLGSQWTLGFFVLVSAGFAFMGPLITVHSIGVYMNPVQLSEAIPSFIVTDYVPESIQKHIVSAIESVGRILIRSCAVEIAVLLCGFLSGIPGLKEFCLLAAFILFYDLCLLFTFYTAILTLKLELRRIRENSESHANIRKLTLMALLGAGSETTEKQGLYSETSSTKTETRIDLSPCIPLNVCTTLTTSTVADTPLGSSVDVNSSSIAPVPKSLLEVHRASSLKDQALIVEVAPALAFQHQTSIASAGAHPIEKMFGLLSFLIQDPVLSKYISLTLVASLLLNIFLLNVAKQSRQEPLPATAQASSVTAPPSTAVTTVVTTTTEVEAQTQRVIQLTCIQREECVAEFQAMIEPTLNKDEFALVRPLEECLALIKSPEGAGSVTDEELVMLANSNKIPAYALEKTLGDLTRAVKIRRALISRATHTKTLENSHLPMYYYDYSNVMGQCCENVIGYIPLPVGVAGPFKVDDQVLYLPMATTEGCLVASTSRGCKAINAGGGATTVLLADGMTRGPCVEFSNIIEAGACKK